MTLAETASYIYSSSRAGKTDWFWCCREETALLLLCSSAALLWCCSAAAAVWWRFWRGHAGAQVGSRAAPRTSTIQHQQAITIRRSTTIAQLAVRSRPP